MSSGGANVRRLVYDGDALVAEYDVNGNMPHRYVHGNDSEADDPLIWYDNFASGWRRALVADHQGSVIGVADMYGNSIAANSYDPWGHPGATPVGRFGYTGQTWVPELGLWHYKARLYSPTLGRFLQVDPIGYDDQVNLYAYVGNDPVNMGDPTGTEGACFYGPSQCGMRQLTPAQERRRQQTVSALANVALIGASFTPVGRGLIWAGRALGIGARVAPRAQSAAAAAGLRTQLAAQEVARGHAWAQHGAQFRSLGIRTQRQFQQHIEGILNNPSAVRTFRDGRSLFVDRRSQTVVWRGGGAEGTAFRPDNFRMYLQQYGIR